MTLDSADQTGASQSASGHPQQPADRDYRPHLTQHESDEVAHVEAHVAGVRYGT
jgi:hypothetical protein